MENIDISVVMTTYNGELYLREQLDSILRQTLRPKEIIIVDDCSSDSTYNILLEYANENSIIKVFRNEKNLGAHKNFRKGFSLSSCPLIAPSDQDDIWRDDKLAILKEKLFEKEVDLVYSQEQILWEDGKLSPDDHDMPALKELVWGNCMKGHTFLFKRELLSVYNVVESLSFDYALALQACITGKYASTKEELSVWRRHSGVMTSAVSNNSELRISNVSRKKKLLYTFTNLKKEKSDPIEISFSNRSKLLSTSSSINNRLMSKMCYNISKQSFLSMMLASFQNVLVQADNDGSLKHRVAHAMWAMRQPWIYWYDMHKLHSLE